MPGPLSWTETRYRVSEISPITITRSGRMPASSHASSALSTASFTVVRRAFAGLSNPRRWRFFVKNSLTEISRWRAARSIAVSRTMGLDADAGLAAAALGAAFLAAALGAAFLPAVLRVSLTMAGLEAAFFAGRSFFSFRGISSSWRFAMALLLFGRWVLVLNRRESTRFTMPAATYLLVASRCLALVPLPELRVIVSVEPRATPPEPGGTGLATRLTPENIRATPS